MIIVNKSRISSFGGMNFVLEYLHPLGYVDLINECLPTLKKQSTYRWSDIINSILSIYLCGGDCIEDLNTHLKPHFASNPFLNMPSPDTVLKRLAELSSDNKTCNTKRGKVTHTYNNNIKMEHLIVSMLKKQGAFKADELIIDYDNTIIYNEKSDSKMTYKRNPGYQPGVCTLNEDQVLYVENRNGNSDAKSFQANTLKRMFNALKSQTARKPDHFRADAASYQLEVVEILETNVQYFYIGCRNSYIEKYFSQISEWQKIDSGDNGLEVGEILITTFKKQVKSQNKTPNT